MISLTANEAKTKFGTMLLTAQSEPVEIVKNGTSVAFVISAKEYKKLEDMKMELVKARFQNISEEDLQDAQSFFDELDSGKYD